MELNKSKCGVLFLAGQSNLSNWELECVAVSGVTIVTEYKYLGVILTKTLSPTRNLQRVADKLVKFQKMSFILRAHKAPPHIIQTLWKVF